MKGLLYSALIFCSFLYFPLAGQDPLTVVVSGPPPSCGGSNDGTAIAQSSGGVPPYSFLWNTGETTPSISGLGPGFYEVTVTDQANTTATDFINFTAPPILELTVSDTSYCDGTGDVVASAQGGVPNYFFTWSNGVNAPAQQGLPPGNYCVTVYDMNGCSEVACIDIADTMTVTVNTTEVSCHDACDATVSAVVSGGTPPYQYAWNVGADTPVIPAMHINTYIVTVTDANGCMQTGTGVVTGPDSLGVTFTADTLECGSTAVATATVQPYGGTQPYFIYWSNGDFGPTAAGLIADSTYFVTVYDDNSCEVVDSLTIQTESTLAANVITFPDFCDVLGPNGSATVMASGGTPPYSYLWSTGATTTSITNLLEGEYFVTVTDNNNCSIELSGIVESTAQNMSVSLTVMNESACGAMDGVIQAITTGGQPPYSYLWNTGDTTQILGNLGTGGLYSVTVTDQQGCAVEKMAIFNESTDLETEVVVTPPGCVGLGSITINPLSGTPPFTYEWNTGDTTQTIDGLGPGDYWVTTTSSEGCTQLDSLGLLEVDGPEVSVVASNPSCGNDTNGSAAAIASGGSPPYTYLWSTGDTTETISNLGPGTYVVTVTDVSGCTGQDSTLLSAPPGLECTIAVTDVSCFGEMDGSASASVNGGTTPYVYSWSTGDTTATITGLGPGMYILTVEDQLGCSKMDTILVNEPEAIELDLSSVDVFCDGSTDGEVSVQATGGVPPYSYVWNTGDTTDTVTGLGAGTYSVTVTDADNCIAEDSIMVTEPGLLDLITNTTDVSCPGAADGTAEASLSGGMSPYSYLWSTGDTTALISGLPGGEYIVTATDGNGCSATDTAIIVEPDPISIIADAVAPCLGDTTGSITLTVEGGTPPYLIEWEDGTTGSVLDMIGPGDYQVTVTDANACTETASISLMAAESPELSLVSVMSTCAGGMTGSAEVEVAGGTPPYIIGWSDGTMGAIATDLGPGDYTVVVMDDNGCMDELTVTIDEDDPEVCNAYIISEISGFGASDGSVGVDPPVLGGDFTYEWNTGSTDQILTDLPAGLYKVTITNSDNGCLSVCEVELLNPAKVGDFVWDDLNENGIQDPGEPGVGGINVTLSGTDDDGNPVNFSTNTDSDGSYVFDGLPGGTYAITFGNLPIEYDFTVPNAGFDDALDSDAGPGGSTGTFELILGTCVLDYDAGLVSICENFTDPGEIAGDEYLCGPGNDPGPIVEVVPPSGGSGAIEYLWMYSTEPGPFDPNTWTLIPNSNTPDYDPGPIAVTTYYARCVRRENCVLFLESNIITKEVGEDAVAVINGPATVCVGDLVTFSADFGGSNAVYAWDFGPNATPSTASTQVVDVEWSSFGLVTIQLTVENDGCISQDQMMISVSDSPIICPPASGPLAPVMSSAPIDEGSADLKEKPAERSQAEVVLYPNPVYDQLTVSLTRPAQLVEIFSIQGKPVRSVLSESARSTFELSLLDLPADTYLIRIQYPDGSSWTDKVLVKH